MFNEHYMFDNYMFMQIIAKFYATSKFAHYIQHITIMGEGVRP